MATMFWKNERDFLADVTSADDNKLAEMQRWAAAREEHADRPGVGRSPKGRRMFRKFRVAAEEELARRGLL
jgi:hypothetical protein